MKINLKKLLTRCLIVTFLLAAAVCLHDYLELRNYVKAMEELNAKAVTAAYFNGLSDGMDWADEIIQQGTDGELDLATLRHSVVDEFYPVVPGGFPSITPDLRGVPNYNALRPTERVGAAPSSSTQLIP